MVPVVSRDVTSDDGLGKFIPLDLAHARKRPGQLAAVFLNRWMFSGPSSLPPAGSGRFMISSNAGKLREPAANPPEC